MTFATMRVFKTVAVDVPDLPDKIKQAREADPRSIREICRQLEMSTTHWYRIEKGEHSMPIETLRNIERVLGVNLDVVID